MTKIPLIVVAGPTASGKTGLAIELAQRMNGEIVSADSMQIYKYMDIGTAKPTAEERNAAVHHMIDVIDPAEKYSVADYTEAAHKCIADIISRGKQPILCGGTGLYINSVVNDVTFGETQEDEALRRELRALAEERGAEYLIKILAEFDPVSAERLHPNNIKRVIRAIEFYNQTGVPISVHQEETKKIKSRYSVSMLCISRERSELYERINKRVDIMLKDGLADEVKHLQDMGYTRDMQSMQGIGYKEMFYYLSSEISLSEAADAIKQGSRRYAKRQLTWFRRDERVKWIDADIDSALQAVEL